MPHNTATTPIHVSTLPNGLRVLSERLPGIKSVGLTWLLPMGTAREPRDRLGIASIWADLLLRGAGTLNSRQQADAFDTLGFSRNATVETFTLSVRATGLGARLPEALPLIVDMVRKPRFDEEHLAPVKDLALQALASLNDDPQERVMLALRAAHAPEPINRSTYGTRAGIGAITRDELVEGWANAAVPDGSILAVAGDVDHDDLVRRLTDLTAGWTGSAMPVTWSGSGPRGVHHEEDDTDQTHIALAYDAPPETEDHAWLERVATSVLSGGMASRLFTEVREKRSLVYSVFASYGAEAQYGRTVSYAGTTPQRAQETLDVLLNELQRIRSAQGLPTAEEFHRAIVGLKSRLVFSGESSSARASAIAHDQRKLGRARSLAELADRYDTITLDALNAYLKDRPLGKLTVASIGQLALAMPEP
jgi:predicted Zn-dependent peptidase